jgi:hypothetical protein
MKRINLTPVAVIGLIALLVLLIGVSGLGGYGGWGVWPGMMGPSMMGNWGFGPFGWLGMIFMWLFPLGFLALLVLGIVWFLQQAGGSSRAGGGPSQTAVGQPCPNCGRLVQADWQVCPHCGQKLT